MEVEVLEDRVEKASKVEVGVDVELPPSGVEEPVLELGVGGTEAG